MSLYECLSIAIAIAGFWLLIAQLKKMRESMDVATASLDNARVDTVLQIESIIWSQKQRLDDVAYEMNTRLSAEEESITVESVEVEKLRLSTSIENYLNPLDRLAYLLLKGKISEEEYRPEYRDVIRTAVESYPDAFGGHRRRHNNILKLHEKWRET